MNKKGHHLNKVQGLMIEKSRHLDKVQQPKYGH
jgi:hypothetical protein